jgi:hypothetical protein
LGTTKPEKFKFTQKLPNKVQNQDVKFMASGAQFGLQYEKSIFTYVYIAKDFRKYFMKNHWVGKVYFYIEAAEIPQNQVHGHWGLGKAT